MSIYNYAKALHDIARQKDKLDVLTYQLDQFKDMVEQHPKWVLIMDSPMVAHHKKIALIEGLAYDVSFLAFLKLLARKHHMHLFLEIYEEWAFLARQYQKIAHVHLYTAKPLTDKQEEALKTVLSHRFAHQTITFHTTIDDKLLGGVKVVYNGQSLDRSILRELLELETFI
ncbi:MAG: ATP synthase F1 subunit delta [Acholeplasmataceae bacterium]|nr:MAG: ATP synthase F1 subunit delta [Acholeplasmataceae bacterium]